MLHFIPDEDEPWQLVATLADAMAPGSYLVLCHGTSDGTPKTARAVKDVYDRSVTTPLNLRCRAGILRFFDGFDLVEPGLVFIPQWRPEPLGDVPKDASSYGNLVGVARKR